MRVERFPVGPLDNNLYLLTVTGSRDAIVVDPSLESEHVLDTIQSRRLTVRKILLTHAHIDHIVMVKAFHEATQAPVWLHEGDRQFYERAAAQALSMGFTWPGGVPVAHWIEDGEEVGLPGLEVRAVHTPGHSPGSVTFVTSEGLIAGDVLFQGSVGRTDLPGGNWDTLLRTIRDRIFPYPDGTVVYPGHGPLTTIGHEKATNPFVGAQALRQA
ncbi:MAG TPA: MBL fold metallo-hydrolase [Candidatus Eisenbacteria bacterium]|nr:MBL fold metallo-hydrolase [Candidatus Eisenbacteria bacterium]